MIDLAPVLARIEAGLARATEVLAGFTPGRIEHRIKLAGDPVTEADLAVNEMLRRTLPDPGEGWLSEETVDDPARLACARAWIVDPLDGTQEFVAGIPEWSVSIGYVVEGRAVAGGICNPVRGETFLGALGSGVRLNGTPCRTSGRSSITGARVLASRSEIGRGEWERFERLGLDVRGVGSVAYKLALVAAGLADATWTLVPKQEWDVAAGTALIRAAGGSVFSLDTAAPRFNRTQTRFEGFVACAPGLRDPIVELLGLGP